MNRLFIATLCFAGCLAAQTSDDALMVVAHGASRGTWNERVVRIVEKVEWPGAKGVAFLTASKPEESLEAVAAKLDATGAKRIVIVPLLVSSFSDHYEEIRFYAGEVKEAGDHVHGKPLQAKAHMAVMKAMDDDPLVSKILADQVRSISKDARAESVVLVAHGPNEDADNQKWMTCLKTHAEYLKQTFGFKRVDVLTLRDDAPKPVRDAATEALREIVKTGSEDSQMLVVPVLISVGHVQTEIAKRLDGLSFQMTRSGVSEHALTAEWIRQRGASVAAKVEASAALQ